jgi:acyl-CoA reductase-like NAD-dependent aldehyde dehydrogenase
MSGHELIRNFINGEWIDARSGRTAPNINPANSESLGEVVVSGREETEAAVAAAKAAFPSWKKVPAPKRGEIVARAADLFIARKEELALALTLEEGKTLNESRGEVQRSINVLQFISGEGRRLTGETVPSELPATFCYTRREPLGVVGVITPWNFPLAIPTWKIAPALVCGNTVVFKPASITPWTARLIVEIFTAAGVPRGVLNCVFGPGSSVGDVIVNHPDVAALTFTGSNEIGTRLYTDGAKTLKKVQCEMGGKNPIIILEDADLELAAVATVQGAFGSTGQRCTATSRAIVVEKVADRFTQLVAEKTRALIVGDGTRPDVQVGPAVDKKQYETDLHYIDVGRSEATLVTGGGPLTGGDLARGLFVAPTIFSHVTRNMRIAQEEVFGPVLSIITVEDFDEALSVANDVKYGLSSSLFTYDMSRVFQYLDRIDTGITHVNSGTVGGEAHLPFGGMKATGLGGREMGSTAIEFFSEWKTVYIDYTGAARTTNIY